MFGKDKKIHMDTENEPGGTHHIGSRHIERLLATLCRNYLPHPAALPSSRKLDLKPPASYTVIAVGRIGLTRSIIVVEKGCFR